MRRTLFVIFSAVMTTASFQWLTVPTDAHHSEAPFHDADRMVVEVRGVVTKWVFRNPHAPEAFQPGR